MRAKLLLAAAFVLAAAAVTGVAAAGSARAWCWGHPRSISTTLLRSG